MKRLIAVLSFFLLFCLPSIAQSPMPQTVDVYCDLHPTINSDGQVTVQFTTKGLHGISIRRVDPNNPSEVLTQVSAGPRSDTNQAGQVTLAFDRTVSPDAPMLLEVSDLQDATVHFRVLFTPRKLNDHAQVRITKGQVNPSMRPVECGPGCFLAQGSNGGCSVSKCCNDGGMIFNMDSCSITCAAGDC